VAVAAKFCVDPERVDMRGAAPEICLDATADSVVSIAEVTSDRARSFVARLGAVEGTDAVKDDAKFFSGGLFREFKPEFAHGASFEFRVSSFKSGNRRQVKAELNFEFQIQESNASLWGFLELSVGKP
jgi:hypothetical protein